MKYANDTLMMLQHVEDAMDTTGGVYDDMINALFAPVLHVMVMGNNSDLLKVIEDIKTLSAHYIGRCEHMLAQNVSKDRVLH